MSRPGHRPVSVSLTVLALAALLFGGATAAAPAADASASAGSRATDVIARTNAIRAEAGCDPVRADQQLGAVAQKHATEMARHRYLEHENRSGTTSGERIRSAGYDEATGENLAHGYPTAAEVMDVWMASAGHRRNIEDCEFTHVGIGYAPDGHYWVQDFGG
ncbi:CAP domain-containing protein [Pseudonocardia zijingensis]|jgi:uncharacterized protein YkwD|uniref:SCP domain-containing protein n=1 Tax=Pseudonocardia zijingensis TaxID=153376 RepID=A0ABP3ZI24_9PSEU